MRCQRGGNLFGENPGHRIGEDNRDDGHQRGHLERIGDGAEELGFVKKRM